MAQGPGGPLGQKIRNRTPLSQGGRRGRFSSSRLQQKAPKRTAPAPSKPSAAPARQQRAKGSLSIGSQVAGRLISAGKAQRY